MGSPSLSLTDIPNADLEVVGLNGRPAVDCGFSLPIVRHKPSDRFALLGRLGERLKWDARGVIDEFAQLGRLTLLESPFPLQAETRAKLYHDSESLPVVAWATPIFLASVEHPQSFGVTVAAMVAMEENTQHQEVLLRGDAETVNAFFWLSNTRDVTSWCDQRAKELIQVYDHGLTSGPPDWPNLERIADFGLCAARDAGLRYALFVRYCAAMYFNTGLPAERALTQYRVFVRNEFKSVTWDRFREDMLAVVMRGKDVAAYRNGVPGESKAPPVVGTPGTEPPAAKAGGAVGRDIDAEWES
jgi:hypothetical protein